MSTNFIQNGIKLVQQAAEADRAKDYPTAYEKYLQGIQWLMTGMKYEKNDASKRTIGERISQYMSRAEQLKQVISGAPEPAAADGTATASRGDADGGAADPDKDKMRGALQGAIVTEKPNVKWDDVAGLEGAKEALKEAVILPVRFPQLFTGKRKPWRGILLYGPPGTGKSYLAKAVATEAASTFFSVSSSDLVSKWQGESERLVRNLFEMARESRPSIIFIDEIDSLCSARGEGENESARRIKTEFLVQMQGVGKDSDNVLVLGATNTPWEIDAAMRRRFEKRVYIPLPEIHARGKMFKIHLGDTPHNLTDADFNELGRTSDGFSGSDISVAVRSALMEPLRKCRQAQCFKPDPANPGMYTPVLMYPNCARCAPDLSSNPLPKGHTCTSCGTTKKTLYDLDSAQLHPPDVCMDDFVNVLRTAHGSVAAEELTRFEEWTSEFGEEGS